MSDDCLCFRKAWGGSVLAAAPHRSDTCLFGRAEVNHIADNSTVGTVPGGGGENNT